MAAQYGSPAMVAQDSVASGVPLQPYGEAIAQAMQNLLSGEPARQLAAIDRYQIMLIYIPAGLPVDADVVVVGFQTCTEAKEQQFL